MGSLNETNNQQHWHWCITGLNKYQMDKSVVLTRNNMDGVSMKPAHLLCCYRPVSNEIQTQLGSGMEGTRWQRSECSTGTLSRALENWSPLPSRQDAIGKPTHVAAASMLEYRITYDGLWFYIERKWAPHWHENLVYLLCVSSMSVTIVYRCLMA